MPLLDLKTNLKSLKFGKDRPGGGSSGQPYIRKSIPEDEDPSNIFNTGGPDNVLRGGLIAPVRAAEDVSRLTQMLIDTRSPNGPLFTPKQLLLSRTSVKVEAGGGKASDRGIFFPPFLLGQAGSGYLGAHIESFPTPRYEDIVKANNKEDTYLENNRLIILNNTINNDFSPKNFNSTGVNLNVGDTLLSYSGGPGSNLGVGRTNIRFADKDKRQRTGKNNPLAVTDPNYFYTGSFKLPQINYSKLLGTSNKQGLTLKDNNINENGQFVEKYYGRIGENSTLSKNPLEKDNGYLYKGGIGNSSTNRTNTPKYNIRFESGSSSKYKELTGEDLVVTFWNEDGGRLWETSVYTPFAAGTFPNNTDRIEENNASTFNQRQLIDKFPVSKGGALQDFRVPLLEGKTESTIMSLAPNYATENIENRVKLGDPGKSNTADNEKNVLRYSTSTEALDKINALELYEANRVDLSKDVKDLVKFRIAAINNNKPDGTAVYMHFRAFIDSFSDNYTSQWSDVNYVGRGNKFYTYGSFDRKISMAFTVYAQSKAELIPMYKKLNYLASTLAPDYSSGGFMRGTLVRLTMGGYLYEQPGFITSLTYDIPQESTWEIGIDENGRSDNTVKELPHMIKVTSLSFTPIHTFLPQKVKNISSYSGERYIALSNGENNNYD